jgi:carbonic anhydrase
MPFDDLLAANDAYARAFDQHGLQGRARKRVAILTCMDSRIEPLAMLGLRPGDAKILRNAGARVTDDVLATLVVAQQLLDVDRVMVIAHTKCRMASEEAALHDAIRAQGGPDTSELTFGADPDQTNALKADVERARAMPQLKGLEVGGFMYDVDTGSVTQVC